MCVKPNELRFCPNNGLKFFYNLLLLNNFLFFIKNYKKPYDQVFLTTITTRIVYKKGF